MDSENYIPKVQRWISKFDMDGKFIEDEISVDSIDFEILKTIFSPYGEDPDLIM